MFTLKSAVSANYFGEIKKKLSGRTCGLSKFQGDQITPILAFFGDFVKVPASGLRRFFKKSTFFLVNQVES